VIDFRYHLVSLVAVFLALALGVLLGTTQLSGTLTDDLRGQVSGLTTDRRDLQGEVKALQGRATDDDAVTASLAPRLVSGVLRGTDVVLVATPQAADATTDGVQKMLEQAGARVTGRVQLTDDYADPRRAADVKSFVTGDGQPSGFQLPETDDAGVLAAALLSYALLGSRDGGAEPASADTDQVLSGFASLEMLRVDSPRVTAGDLAVLVTSGPVKGEDAPARVRSLASLSSALDKAGRGAVVAGTAAASRAGDGLVFAVRADRGLAGALSTVDDVDRPVGQVASVFALAQEAGGRSGQYGTAGGADAPFPPTSSS
jgi:hypothetical protein